MTPRAGYTILMPDIITPSGEDLSAPTLFLTPDDVDVRMYPKTGMGLSFSLGPKPNSVMTTIGAVNATGVLYAVHDKGAHVSVHPVDATIIDWYHTGPMSKWTMALKTVVIG